MINKIPVITIDGPSGVGKSTISKMIADQLHWHILESGIIYRFIALLALKKNVAIIENNILPLLKKIDFLSIQKKNKFYSKFLYCNQVSEISSQLATYPNIRNILLKKQRLFRCFPGLIAEGRDMGTVIFPDAIVKFFLSAHLKIRVQRRMLELKKNGYDISFKNLSIKMENRDKQDQNRLISPLCIPKNAIILDSTHMNLSEVLKISMKYIIPKIKI